MLVDAHCHIELEEFDRDRDEVIVRSKKEKVAFIVTAGTEPIYFKKVIGICDKFDLIYGTLGLHPHESDKMDEMVKSQLRSYIMHNKIVALGEIGLDFFKNYSSREAQMRSFEIQIEIAREAAIPVVIHSRNAEKETIELLKDKNLSGLIHCFSYGKEAAKKFLDMGFFISIPGTVTYVKNEKFRDIVRYLPIDRILTETDAPFISPEPKRGTRNEPAFVKYTMKKIAEIKGLREEDLSLKIKSNLLKVFPKIKEHP